MSDTLKIGSVIVKNFMRLEVAEAAPNGNHLMVSGPNRSGKTSFVDGIWATLGGLSAREIPEPIHVGEDKASGLLYLADDQGEIAYTVARTWTESGSRLTVTAADGKKIGRPQELLDSFLDAYTFDPGSFLRKRPQDQLDDVLRVCGIVPPVDEVLAITGEDLPSKGGESASAYMERLSADEDGEFYRRRRDKNRDFIQKDKARIEQAERLAAIGGPVPADQAQVSVSELLKRREGLATERARRESLLTEFRERRSEFAQASERLKTVKEALKQKVDEINKLHLLLKEKTAEADALAKREAVGATVCAELEAEAAEAQRIADAAPDSSPAIAALDNDIRAVEIAKKSLAAREFASKESERLTSETAAEGKRHARLDEILGELRELRAGLLDGVDLGVPGLAVGDGELTLTGVSFKQASTAQKISVACALAFRRNPRLKILRLDDAEHLDGDSRSLLLELADRHGWQCVMTFVKDESGLNFEIVEATAGPNGPGKEGV